MTRGSPAAPRPGLELRRRAAELLDRALATSAPADAFLEVAARDLSAPDRALLTQLVYGALRWLRRLDEVVVQAAERPLERIDRELLAPLRIGVLQLLLLDRIPAHAAVDTAVALARERRNRGAAGFVNAVLRNVARRPRLEEWPVGASDPLERLAIETSHPTELVGRWWRIYGEEQTRRLLAASNREKPLHVLAFSDRGGRRALAADLAAEGVTTEPSELSPLGLIVRQGDALAGTPFQRGDLYVADEGAQAAAVLPPPRPEERVLDLAAAPGGKSFALLAAEPAVRVVALDREPARIARMAVNARRLGREVRMVTADGAAPPLAASFDRVVADLPCTGTGTLRKHPELKWRFSVAALERLAGQGLELLRAAAGLVAPGGLLSVITCSLEPEENEQVVATLLHTGRHLGPVEPPLLKPHEDLQTDSGAGRWRLLTGGDHDGFTVHLLRRRR